MFRPSILCGGHCFISMSSAVNCRLRSVVGIFIPKNKKIEASNKLAIPIGEFDAVSSLKRNSAI